MLSPTTTTAILPTPGAPGASPFATASSALSIDFAALLAGSAIGEPPGTITPIATPTGKSLPTLAEPAPDEPTNASPPPPADAAIVARFVAAAPARDVQPPTPQMRARALASTAASPIVLANAATADLRLPIGPIAPTPTPRVAKRDVGVGAPVAEATPDPASVPVDTDVPSGRQAPPAAEAPADTPLPAVGADSARPSRPDTGATPSHSGTIDVARADPNRPSERTLSHVDRTVVVPAAPVRTIIPGSSRILETTAPPAALDHISVATSSRVTETAGPPTAADRAGVPTSSHAAKVERPPAALDRTTAPIPLPANEAAVAPKISPDAAAPAPAPLSPSVALPAAPIPKVALADPSSDGAIETRVTPEVDIRTPPARTDRSNRALPSPTAPIPAPRRSADVRPAAPKERDGTADTATTSAVPIDQTPIMVAAPSPIAIGPEIVSPAAQDPAPAAVVIVAAPVTSTVVRDGPTRDTAASSRRDPSRPIADPAPAAPDTGIVEPTTTPLTVSPSPENLTRSKEVPARAGEPASPAGTIAKGAAPFDAVPPSTTPTASPRAALRDGALTATLIEAMPLEARTALQTVATPPAAQSAAFSFVTPGARFAPPAPVVIQPDRAVAPPERATPAVAQPNAAPAPVAPPIAAASPIATQPAATPPPAAKASGDDRDAPAIPVTAVAPAAPLQRADAPVAAPLDLRHESWPHAMVDRIAAQVEAVRDAADARDTRIRVAPDTLGTIDLSVRTDGDTIHVHFTAEQPQTRALLIEAQPRLIEAAEARGLKLGDSAVGGGQPQSQANLQNQQQSQPQPQSQQRQSAPRAKVTPARPATPADRADDGGRIA